MGNFILTLEHGVYLYFNCSTGNQSINQYLTVLLYFLHELGYGDLFIFLFFSFFLFLFPATVRIRGVSLLELQYRGSSNEQVNVLLYLTYLSTSTHCGYFPFHYHIYMYTDYRCRYIPTLFTISPTCPQTICAVSPSHVPVHRLSLLFYHLTYLSTDYRC